MTLKKFVLVNKSDHKIIYGGQIFEDDSDVNPNIPTGLLGGFGQIDWYWVEITNTDPANITNGHFNKVTRTPPGGETIDASTPNVLVAEEGVWS